MLKSKAVNNVLLIDDNDTDNFIHRTVLELNSFSEQIVIKNSGRSALEYLSDNQTQTEHLPEIIFLDLNMPVVNGFAFLHEFENFPIALKNKCKIIVLSSSENAKDKERVSNVPHVMHYVTKPLSEDSLEEIRSLLQLNKLKSA